MRPRRSTTQIALLFLVVLSALPATAAGRHTHRQAPRYIGWLPFVPPTLEQVSKTVSSLPVQIWQQLGRIEAMATSTVKNTLPRTSLPVALPAETRTAIRSLVQQLPATPRTRQLQNKAQQLFMELKQIQETTTSDVVRRLQLEKKTAELVAQLQALDADLDQDRGQRQELLEAIESRALTGTTPQAATRPDGSSVPPSVIGPDYARLQRGDILLRRSGSKLNYLWAMNFSHTGIFSGYDQNGNGWVYESNAFVGVQKRPLEEWRRADDYVALGHWVKEDGTHPDEGAQAQTQVSTALDWAESKWGADKTPYNYWYPDRVTNRRLYCSQLVWKVFERLQVDLNSNDPKYMTWLAARYGDWIVDYAGVPSVAPDELYLSPHLTFYSQGRN